MMLEQSDQRAMLPDTATDRDAAMSAPSMTLYHNPLSPFVRKVMVLLHETGQQNRGPACSPRSTRT